MRGRPWTTTTNDKGTFELRLLPAQGYALHVFAQSKLRQVLEFAVKDGPPAPLEATARSDWFRCP